MRRALVVFTCVLSSLLPMAVRADCRSSASGAFSADVRLSPASGGMCLSAVRVFEGGSCDEARLRWSTTLGCSETRRMVVSDRGRLVSLLARRASRRSWEIVRVFEADVDHASVRSVRLEDLPGLPASARRPELDLDASELRLEVEPPLIIAVPVLETLGRARGRRRILRP